MTWAHSSPKAKLKQTLAPLIFAVSACHTSLLSVQSEGSHILNHTSCVTSHSLFSSGALTWDQRAVNTAAPCFNRGVLCKETQLGDLDTSNRENLELSPRSWKHRQMCGFSWKALPKEEKQQRINSELCMCECVHQCAWVRADQNANSISPSRTSWAIRCARRVLVWLKECSKDPLQALLKSSSNHLKRWKRLAQLSAG